MPSPNPSGGGQNVLNAVAVVSESDAWAVGERITMHWNGSTWVTAIAAHAGISPASLYQFCRPAIPK